MFGALRAHDVDSGCRVSRRSVSYLLPVSNSHWVSVSAVAYMQPSNLAPKRPDGSSGADRVCQVSHFGPQYSGISALSQTMFRQVFLGCEAYGISAAS